MGCSEPNSMTFTPQLNKICSSSSCEFVKTSMCGGCWSIHTRSSRLLITKFDFSNLLCRARPYTQCNILRNFQHTLDDTRVGSFVYVHCVVFDFFVVLVRSWMNFPFSEKFSWIFSLSRIIIFMRLVVH